MKTNARAENAKASLPETRGSSRLIRVGFWACIVISVAVVLRRTVALAHPPQSAPPQLAELDAAFASHAALTLAHIFPSSRHVKPWIVVQGTDYCFCAFHARSFTGSFLLLHLPQQLVAPIRTGAHRIVSLSEHARGSDATLLPIACNCSSAERRSVCRAYQRPSRLASPEERPSPESTHL